MPEKPTKRAVKRSTTASCLSRSSAPAFVMTWTRTWREAPVTSEMAAGGSSWTKAAVFSRNIGISGTPSTSMTIAAALAARRCGSGKVPLGA